MLIHYGNPHVKRITRTSEVDHFAIHMDLTFVRTQISAEYIHQRALTGAILTAQRVYLASGNGHADLLQCLYTRKRFAYVPDFNSGGLHLNVESRINELVFAEA